MRDDDAPSSESAGEGAAAVDPAAVRHPVDGGRRGAAAARRADVVEAPSMRRSLVYVTAALTGLALGLNWPVMALGVDLMPPLWLASARVIGGGLVIGVGLAFTGKIRIPARRDVPVMATIMLLRLGVVTTFVFLALRYTPPGRSSVLVYSSVLWGAPLARWLLGERVSRVRAVGVVAGVTGIVVLVAPWGLDWSNRGLIVGYGLLLGASLAQALGTVHVRGHTWSVPPLHYMPIQLIGAGLLIAAFALVIEGVPQVQIGWVEVAVLGYQSVIASAFGFWGFLVVTRSLPAVSSQLVLMSTPPIGVAASAIFMGEVLDVTLIAGMVLIFSGVAAGIISDRPAAATRRRGPDDGVQP